MVCQCHVRAIHFGHIGQNIQKFTFLQFNKLWYWFIKCSSPFFVNVINAALTEPCVSSELSSCRSSRTRVAFEQTNETIPLPGGSLEKRGKPSSHAGRASDSVSPSACRCLMGKRGRSANSLSMGNTSTEGFLRLASHTSAYQQSTSPCGGNSRSAAPTSWRLFTPVEFEIIAADLLEELRNRRFCSWNVAHYVIYLCLNSTCAITKWKKNLSSCRGTTEKRDPQKFSIWISLFAFCESPVMKKKKEKPWRLSYMCMVLKLNLRLNLLVSWCRGLKATICM